MRFFHRGLIGACFVTMFIFAFFVTGCGGGSQSSGVSRPDSVGIAATLSGFMQSIKTGNPKAFMSPRLQELSETSGGIHTLKVWDFGADINDPNDNHYHFFTVPEDGINQLTDDFARAYAVKSEAGRELRIDFELVKIDGEWLIEAIAFSAKDLGYVNAGSLMPLQKNNEWASVLIPVTASQTLYSATMVKGRINQDPLTRDSRQVFTLDFTSYSEGKSFNLSNYASTISTLKTTDSWSILRSLYSGSGEQPYSLRLAIGDLFTQPEGGRAIGYANDLGLFQYGTENFNSGGGVKFLNATSLIGDTTHTTVNVQWNDGSTYQVFLASRLARKVGILTFAGSYNAWQVDLYARFVGSVPEGESEEMFWSRLYAEDVGEVAQIAWNAQGQAEAIHLLYSANINGKAISPVDQGISGTPTTGFRFVAQSPLPDAVIGQIYDLLMVDGGQTPVTASVSGSLPPGITVSGPYLDGNPTTEGSYSFGLTFTDASGAQVSGTFSMQVLASGSQTLAFSHTGALPVGAVNSTYNTTLVSGGTTPYSFALDAGQSLPSGLGFTSAGISGTPLSSGTTELLITASDGAGAEIAATFTLAINPELQFAHTSPLTAGTLGTNYARAMGIYGVPSVTNTLVSGSLPPGITVSASGLSGTPTSAGNYSFTIQAQDGSGKTISQAYTLEIVSGLVFAQTSPLPDIVFEQPYSQQLVSGGKASYTIGITQGSLPAGISMNESGYLTGSTNSALGDYSFTFVVSDSIGNTLEGTYTVKVVGLYETAPTIQWSRFAGSTGGSAEYYETANSIINLPNGEYLVVGSVQGGDQDITTTYRGGTDYWVTKMTSDGQIAWAKTYGGSGDEEAYDACVAPDGNYVVVGQSTSSDWDVSDNFGLTDIWVIKISAADGSIIWQKSYGGSGSDQALSVDCNATSELFVVGNTNSSEVSTFHYHYDFFDAWVLKIQHTDGTLVWDRAYGGSDGPDEGFCIKIDAGNNVFVAGATASTDGDRPAADSLGGKDAWFLKLQETNGTIVWQRSFGGNGTDISRSFVLKADGTFVLSGDTASSDVLNYNGGTDMLAAQIGADGTLMWQRALGGTLEERGYSVELLPDGSYVFAGSTGSSDSGDVSGFIGNVDGWLVKLDSTGSNLLWQKTYGGTASDYFKKILYANGKLVTTGTTSSTDVDLADRTAASYNFDWWTVQF